MSRSTLRRIPVRRTAYSRHYALEAAAASQRADYFHLRSCTDLTLEFDLPASSDAPTDEIRSPEPTGEALQMMPKRTWQPKRLQRKRKHGFLKCVRRPYAALCLLSP